MFVMGSLLVVVGALLVGLLTALFRHPRAPRWTRPELVAMLSVIPVTGVLGLGLGYILGGFYELMHGVGEVYELGAPVVAAIVIAGLWWLSGFGRNSEAYGATGTVAAGAVTPVPDGSPGAPTRPPRKAA